MADKKDIPVVPHTPAPMHTADIGKDQPMLISVAQFEQMMASALKVAMTYVQPEEGEDEATFQKKIMDQIKARSEKWAREFPVTYVLAKSEDTDAEYVAVIACSPKFPDGRVVSLEEYRHPDGITKHQREGGRVPDGMTMRRKDGTPSADYKMWLTANFWIADLRTYVGKPFRKSTGIGPMMTADEYRGYRRDQGLTQPSMADLAVDRERASA